MIITTETLLLVTVMDAIGLVELVMDLTVTSVSLVELVQPLLMVLVLVVLTLGTIKQIVLPVILIVSRVTEAQNMDVELVEETLLFNKTVSACVTMDITWMAIMIVNLVTGHAHLVTDLMKLTA